MLERRLRWRGRHSADGAKGLRREQDRERENALWARRKQWWDHVLFQSKESSLEKLSNMWLPIYKAKPHDLEKFCYDSRMGQSLVIVVAPSSKSLPSSSSSSASPSSSEDFLFFRRERYSLVLVETRASAKEAPLLHCLRSCVVVVFIRKSRTSVDDVLATPLVRRRRRTLESKERGHG